MRPSHCRKQGIRYRYYVSSPLLHGQPARAGSVHRVPAAEVEALVGQAVREHLGDAASGSGLDLISSHVLNVEVQADQLVVELKALKPGQPGDGRPPHHDPTEHGAERSVLRVAWRKTPSKRRREIIPPQSTAPRDVRPIRAETRAKLIASIARGRRWLDEMVTGAVTTIEQIAARDKCSVRQVNMTISLAFLAPNLVQAAVEGQCRGGLASCVCAMLLRNGPASMRCSACRSDPGRAGRTRTSSQTVMSEPKIRSAANTLDEMRRLLTSAH
jgi:site-specific DNA recombinase